VDSAAVLEDLQPAVKVEAPQGWRPAIEFDGTNGEATTPGLENKPNFDEFLADAGFDINEIEIVGTPRTSRWQVASPWPAEPRWLTSYRFNFRKKSGQVVDLPLLYAEAKKTKAPKVKPVTEGKSLVVALADFQVGKVDHRGGTKELLQRIFEAYDRVEAKFKSGRYEQIILVDVGDIVENFSNAASEQQQYSNDLSLMDQVDLSTTLIWEITKRASKYTPNVVYASIASNHCRFKLNKQNVGNPGQDDWGIMIAKQIHRLATETGLPVKVLIPNPQDESLAYDVFGDGFHVLGIWHGHQCGSADKVGQWWKAQAFGQQPVAAATVALTGHFHHLRVQEMALSSNGGSRFWIQAPTMDAGSNWYRLNSGEDSQPGIAVFELERGKHFAGSVQKL
jgi:hypothetical protein